MLIDKIVCVGIGQCGSNMVMELEKFNFNSFYVNTSLEDLDTIETDIKNKYHIKGTNGMAKDREQALECITSNNNADNIANAIYEQYAMAEIIYFFYSLSGGTGGTMGNIIAETMADMFPEKTINVVAVKPKSLEDIGLQANAIESLTHLKELQQSQMISQVMLLDNDSRDDIFSINKDFATCLNEFVSFDEISNVGNLDENERERLLKEPGMGIILDFSNEDFGNGLNEASEKSIYAEWSKSPTLHGLILNKKQNTDVNRQLIKEVLGMATYTHPTQWDNENNIILSVGMKFNDNVINELKRNAQSLFEKKKKIEEAQNKTIETVEFDAKSIIQNSNNRKRVRTSSQQTGTNRRHRRASSIIDKYKNMDK